MTTTLPRRCIHDVRIAWVDNDVCRAGVLGPGNDGLPCLAAVGRFIQSAFAAAGPKRSLCRDKNDIAVTRIDRYAADVLARL